MAMPSAPSILEELHDEVQALTPTNATQRWLQPQATDLIGTMIAARWQLGQAKARAEPRCPYCC
jgi:hypothetical protein